MKKIQLICKTLIIILLSVFFAVPAFAPAEAQSGRATPFKAVRFSNFTTSNVSAPSAYQNTSAIDMAKSTSSSRIGALRDSIDSNAISNGTIESRLKSRLSPLAAAGETSYAGTAGAAASRSFANNVGGINVYTTSENTLGLSSSGGAYAMTATKNAVIDAAGGVSFFAGARSVNASVAPNRAGVTSASFTPVFGGDAGADGKFYLGRKGFSIEGNASARAGAWADASLSHKFRAAGENLAGIGVRGGIGAGLAAGIGGGISLRTDKVGFAFNMAVGPFKGKISASVNPEGIWRAVSRSFAKARPPAKNAAASPKRIR